jgi:hypothetical protein
MAFQKVQESAEIVIAYTGSGSNMVNVVGAHKVGGYVLADLTSMAAAVDAMVTLEWLPIQTNDVTYVSTTVRGLDKENDLEAVDATGTAAGGDIEKGEPGNVTIAIKKASGFTGRSARGRLYWIGMISSALGTDLNIVDPTPLAEIVAAVDDLRLTIIAEGWLPVIISRFAGGVKRTDGAVFSWLTSTAVGNTVDSQRRRLQA